MKNNKLRAVIIVILLALIIILSYEENRRMDDSFKDYDTSLGSIFSFSDEDAGEEDIKIIDIQEEDNIPEHIKNSPCGSNFKGEGICAGTCKRGSCVQNGKSCYCKL